MQENEMKAPVKSVVQVYFPAKGTKLAYFNDLFDLHIGDIVYVEGKLEGLRGQVMDVAHNFKIKVSGMIDEKKINTLVGVAGLIRFVDDIELTNRLLDRAFNSREDRCICRLRRGIRIYFYVY